MPAKRTYGPEDACKYGHVGDWHAYPDGSCTICKQCRREGSLRWQRENPEKYKENQRKTRIKNADKIKEHERKRNQDPARQRYMKDKNLMRKYGITIEEYEEKILQQDNKCPICREELTRGRAGCVVDHDHRTKQVRAILCSPCNKGIGHFKEDLKRINAIISYLEKWNAYERTKLT